MITTLGLTSGALTAVSFLPQVIRAVRTGSTADLSWAWLGLFLAGLAGWLAYGVATGDLAIITTNAIMVGLVVVLLVLKVRNDAAPGTPVQRGMR